MTMHKKIKEEIKDAMRAKDEVRLTTLRSLLSAFTNELVVKKRKPDEELSDEDVFSVLRRAAKQRKDSIEQFKKGDRADLADQEQKELVIIESFLPKQMSREEIQKHAEAKKAELGITEKAHMGKLIGALMQDLKGKADGNDVKSVVEALF